MTEIQIDEVDFMTGEIISHPVFVTPPTAPMPAQPEPEDHQPTIHQLEIAEDFIAKYENMAAYISVLKMDMEAAKNEIIPASLKADLNAIDAEFSEKIENAENHLLRLKTELQEVGKAVGRTINGKVYQIVYSRGSWKINDVEGLLMLATSTPAIMRYIGRGKPSASVQVRRGGKQ